LEFSPTFGIVERVNQILIIILWMGSAMCLTEIFWNIGDLMLDYVGFGRTVVHVLRECWPLLFFTAPIVAVILAARGILPGSQETVCKRSERFWFSVGVTSLVIHAVFCMLLYPFRVGNLVANQLSGRWLLIFNPQVILVYFLPPDYWLKSDGNGVEHISYFHFWGKMLVAFPASLADSLVLVSGALAWLKWRKPER
jgi:hypothetical protein